MMSRVLKIVLKVLGWAVAGILAVAAIPEREMKCSSPAVLLNAIILVEKTSLKAVTFWPSAFSESESRTSTMPPGFSFSAHLLINAACVSSSI